MSDQDDDPAAPARCPRERNRHMTPIAAPVSHAHNAKDEVRMKWRGVQSHALLETAREVCIEGALRASKTTICLWREHMACRTHPKIPIMLARLTEEAVFGLIVPLWNRICEQCGD